MARLRTLSGREIAAIFGEFGFVQFSQRGSHIKLRRMVEKGRVQTLTIPDHREVDRGTVHAIIRQAGRFVPESELRRKFFAD